MEGEIGRFCRRHLVPAPPAVASLAALNQLISTGDMADDGRVITGWPVTIAAAFAEEQRAMGPLPGEPFDPARLLQARVDGRARVCVRQNYYSVPGRYAGRRLPVRLSATTVEVLDGPQMAARHERAAGRYGDAAGTGALIEVLLAHRTLPAAAIEAAMARAVASGVLDAQAVIIDARRRAGPAGRAGHPARRGMPHPNANGNNSAVLSPLSPLAVPLSPRGPSAAPGLLGTDADQQAQHHARVQPRRLRRGQQRLGFLQRQAPLTDARSALRHLHQCRHVAQDPRPPREDGDA